ncbi:hypothetical protein A7982_13786 [Minicystis rosea]|nr:hypothetical protein A7982_13786 [Minicystis rosea]
MRHRAKIAIERYPAGGDEARAVLKELTGAIAAEPKASTLHDWTELNDSITKLSKSLEEMNNPNLDAKLRQHAAPVMQQRKEHFLADLDLIRTQCSD